MLAMSVSTGGSTIASCCTSTREDGSKNASTCSRKRRRSSGRNGRYEESFSRVGGGNKRWEVVSFEQISPQIDFKSGNFQVYGIHANLPDNYFHGGSQSKIGLNPSNL